MNGAGGFSGYPLAALYEEVAFVAYHFHWPLEQVMDLEHASGGAGWQEISAINQRLNGE